MAEDPIAQDRITWKRTKFENIEASSVGTLRKADTKKLLAQHVAGRDYYYCVIDANHTRVRVSVLICETFHGPRPSKQHLALHGNGDSLDNRPTNLRWGTQKENRDDMIEHGTVLSGARNPNARLTEEQVREIRRLLPANRKRGQKPLIEDVARQFGIARSAAGMIAAGKCWTYLE